MFTTNHFILLAISIVIIFLFIFINVKKNVSLDKNITFMLVICFASELTKISVNIVEKEAIVGSDNLLGGHFLSPTALPFHLCSIQIFFFIALKFIIKNDSIKKKLLAFMFPTAVIGAICSLLIPTEGVDFVNPQVYEFFIFHSCLIGFGLCIVIKKWTIIDFKSIPRNILLIFLVAIFDLWMNSILSEYHANFLYLSRPPMENLPFLTDKYGWGVYIAHLVLTAITLIVIVQLPFAISHHKKNKTKTA